MSDKVVCKDTTIFGFVFQGCGWEGERYELYQEWFSTISPLHPLSGSEGYRYKCPKCGKVIEEETIRQS